MLSIVIPVYNEEDNLPSLVERLTLASTSWNIPYEVVFVDDGSKDQTLSLLQEIHRTHSNYKYLSFSRNFGHQTAVSAGLQFVSGQVIAIMDADLQDPPEELGRFLDKWRDGFQVVFAVRTKRKEGLFKRGCYWAFYRILHSLSSVDIPLDSGDFCVMDRVVVDHLNRLPERNRFVRGLRSWVGFNQVGVSYERSARHAGEVKYTFTKLFRLALDGLVSFTTRPLKFIGMTGLIISVVAFIGMMVFLTLSIFNVQIFGHSPREAPGYTTLTFLVLLLGGFQLLSLGILGEYVGRIFDEVKGRPIYVIKQSEGVTRAHFSQAALHEKQL
jgi:polyisoprenyl-phosphate glycosyltransferase